LYFNAVTAAFIKAETEAEDSKTMLLNSYGKKNKNIMLKQALILESC